MCCWSFRGAYCNLFFVCVYSEIWRKAPYFDLRHVYKFLYKKKFRCEDLSVAKKILRLAYYMFSFDLKSGYHHVGIFPDSQK